MPRKGFASNFLWGTATASYQVEGAANEDGRGLSIWDTFSYTPGKVAFGHNGDRAADQYHRYREDVRLMRELGAKAYRFSIAWPRIFPEADAKQNPKGFDYYNRLLDELLAAGIKPAVTLYHWDLPQYLEAAGGWPERDTALRFADYSEACFKALGDRIDFWITLNEPWCSAFPSYEVGRHAPGRQDRPAAYRAVHHLLLGHGLAVERYRKGGFVRKAPGGVGKIGITLNLGSPRPATRSPEDILAADRGADKHSRMFMDPLAGRGYPKRHLKAYPDVKMPIEAGDMELIAAPLDFLGVNYYWEDALAHDAEHPEHFKTVPTCWPKTAMGWDVVPDGLYRLLKWVNDNYSFPELYITENGCAYFDKLSDDETRCHDPERVAYLKGHFKACLDAIADGVPLKGYFLWSFVDNFEWAHGYTKRFGIVYCDYQDMRRIPKDSYYYYREVISGAVF